MVIVINIIQNKLGQDEEKVMRVGIAIYIQWLRDTLKETTMLAEILLKSKSHFSDNLAKDLAVT